MVVAMIESVVADRAQIEYVTRRFKCKVAAPRESAQLSKEGDHRVLIETDDS